MAHRPTRTSKTGVSSPTDIAQDRIRSYGIGEEIANSIVHGIGLALAIAGLVLLILYAAGTDGWRLASAIIYGITLIFEYAASTFYHALPQPKAKYVFKVLDHAGIYLLIAGTYTPFTLVTLRDDGGWWLFIAIWGAAIVGIATEAFWAFRPRWLSVVIYLVMGWAVVFSMGPLIENLPPRGLWLLIAGGLCYTGGTVFYLLKRVPYLHAVWHTWVLAGSVCHFLAVLLYVV
jgi:hemolysin III